MCFTQMLVLQRESSLFTYIWRAVYSWFASFETPNKLEEEEVERVPLLGWPTEKLNTCYMRRKGESDEEYAKGVYIWQVIHNIDETPVEEAKRRHNKWI